VGPGAGAGGGGGGLFGGGGGGGSSAGGGGGGGSSGFGAGASNTSTSVDNTGAPAITLLYTPPTGGGGGGGGGGPPPPTKAAITGLGMTNSTFAVATATTPLTGATTSRRSKAGTIFSFRLDQAATVKIAIQTRASGRRDKGVCKPPSRNLRHKPRCARTITIAGLTRTAHAGLNKVAFTGRAGNRALPPGNYAAVFTALDTAGTSPPKTLHFTITKH
jgi:hypothetical protein